MDRAKTRVKQWLFGLLGKHPEAIVVSFRSGDDALADAMCAEIRRLEPSRRHFEVRLEDASGAARLFRGYRIGLAPVLFTDDPKYRPLRVAALRLAPRKILAYNARLERHHLRWSQPIASWLFVRGVPLDRIFLRPAWLCPWRKDRTIRPSGHREIEGRARREGRASVAVLTPYFPFPLAHGGAVRIFHLLRETAREFDVILYAFSEGEIGEADLRPVLRFASRVYLVEKPRYREPRWSTLWPPEVCEYQSPAMWALWNARAADVSQVEYTALAPYGGDILVEHDVTWDLYAQVFARKTLREEGRFRRGGIGKDGNDSRIAPSGDFPGWWRCRRRTGLCWAWRMRGWWRTAWIWSGSTLRQRHREGACCLLDPSGTFPTWWRSGS